MIPAPLPANRVSPYLRALAWGLHALAPSDDYVPLGAARAHLEALDPGLSGSLLGPPELDSGSGLPSFPWMERALAEAELARRGDARTDPDDAALARALSLDAELGQRMGWRRALHRHLRRKPLLPASSLRVVVRRVEPRHGFRLTYDRLFPQAGWMRLRAELEGPVGWRGDDLFAIQSDDSVVADRGLQHLFARHSVTPLPALLQQLQAATAARIIRLSRSFVGPFWFPGGPMPEHAPDWARGALTLHLSLGVLGTDVHHSVHRDPWVPPVIGEVLPDGYGLFRERRFATSPARVDHARAWCAARAAETVVVPLRPA